MFKRDVQTLADILTQCLRHDGLETPTYAAAAD